MPTHLTDSQLARFRTNPLEPFDKVNIGIKSILASHVIQSKNLANALDRHNICSWVFLFAQHKQGDRRAWFHFNSGLLELNLQLYLDEVCLEFHDSIHAPFSAVHLKWSKDCIIQLARSTCSCELAGSSLVVALKLRNIKVGCPAHVRCNYNFLILLCSSTKIKCHCGDSDGSILQRLIKCCTRLPAELDGDFGNSNHHFVQFHQNWEMLPTWHFSWTAQDTHSKKSVLCSSPKGHNSNKVKWISLSAQKDRK